MLKDKYNSAVEIAEGVYWIGYNYETIFRTNPYLIVDGDEAVLIDPGSSFDFFSVRAKAASIVPLSKIHHIILHHQDPDLCGSTTQFEAVIDHEIKVYNPLRSSFFMKCYGIQSPVTAIEKDKEEFRFQSGRTLKFFMTPYCHAPGAMVTYDEKTKIMFTSDIFGAFNKDWELYADEVGDEKHLETIKAFMEPYMGSKEAIANAVGKFSTLDIQTLCPQHGSIIRKNIPEWIASLKNMHYGKALEGEVRWW